MKKGEATIKDLSKEEMNKIIELAGRLGQEKKQKEHFQNLYEELKIEHEQLKRDMMNIVEVQQKDAEENRFLKLQLKNSLRKLEPFRSSLGSTKIGEGKEDQDPNVVVSVEGSKDRSRSNSKKKEISELKVQIEKMAKQLKYYSPPLPFGEKSRVKVVDTEESRQIVKEQRRRQQRGECERNTQLEQKLRMYENIKNRYSSNEQSYIEDESTKLCEVERKASEEEYVTARKSRVQQRQSKAQRSNFYSSDLLDLVEMLQ